MHELASTYSWLDYTFSCIRISVVFFVVVFIFYFAFLFGLIKKYTLLDKYEEREWIGADWWGNCLCVKGLSFDSVLYLFLKTKFIQIGLKIATNWPTYINSISIFYIYFFVLIFFVIFFLFVYFFFELRLEILKRWQLNLSIFFFSFEVFSLSSFLPSWNSQPTNVWYDSCLFLYAFFL